MTKKKIMTDGEIKNLSQTIAGLFYPATEYHKKKQLDKEDKDNETNKNRV